MIVSHPMFSAASSSGVAERIFKVPSQDRVRHRFVEQNTKGL